MTENLDDLRQQLKKAWLEADHDSVVVLSDEILGIAPSDWEAVVAKANSLYLLHPESEDIAFSVVEEALRRAEPPTEIMVQLATIENLCGRFDAAEQHLRKVLQVSPSNYAALRSLALVGPYAGARVKQEEALSLLTRAAQISPDRWEAWAQLAQLQRTFDKKSARANYQKAIELIGDQVPIVREGLQRELKALTE